jgi:uncharacterized damage-inducible protein DinB
MDRKEQLLGIERERWVAFSDLIGRVPPDRFEEPILNEDGWSVKDLLWHMASWDREAARALEQVRLGTYEDGDWGTEAKNERFLVEGRATDLATVRTEWLAARKRVLAEMATAPEVTTAVEEWFSESAYKHIEDHAPELTRFVERLM